MTEKFLCVKISLRTPRHNAWRQTAKLHITLTFTHPDDIRLLGHRYRRIQPERSHSHKLLSFLLFEPVNHVVWTTCTRLCACANLISIEAAGVKSGVVVYPRCAHARDRVCTSTYRQGIITSTYTVIGYYNNNQQCGPPSSFSFSFLQFRTNLLLGLSVMIKSSTIRIQ